MLLLAHGLLCRRDEATQQHIFGYVARGKIDIHEYIQIICVRNYALKSGVVALDDRWIRARSIHYA